MKHLFKWLIFIGVWSFAYYVFFNTQKERKEEINKWRQKINNKRLLNKHPELYYTYESTHKIHRQKHGNHSAHISTGLRSNRNGGNRTIS